MKKLSKRKLPAWVIRNFHKKLNLKEVIVNNLVPQDIVDDYIINSKELIMWDDIIENSKWTINMAINYLKYCKRYESFYVKYKHAIVSRFFEEYIGDMTECMSLICKYGSLFETYIDENADKMDWNMLSENVGYWNYTGDFLLKHIDDLDFKKLIYWKVIPMDIVIKFPDKFNVYDYYVLLSSGKIPYPKEHVEMFKNHFKSRIQAEFINKLKNTKYEKSN